MRSFYIIIAVTLALAFGTQYADAGETGAAFLSLDAGADAIAMGGTAATRAGLAGSVFGNPGGLGWLRGTSLTFAHSEHVQSIRYENLGAAYGTDQLTLAASVRGLFIDGLEERTGPSESPLSQFGATGVAPAVFCAKSFGRHFAAGTSLRYVYQKIGTDHASALANDIGVSFISGVKGLQAGAALTNWGSGIKFTSQSYSLPARLRAGASYALLDGALSAAADLVKPFLQQSFACLGAEGVIKGRISLRAGYKGGLSAAGGMAGFSAGLGVKVRGYDVDYAFASHGELGFAHHLSLSFSTGQAAKTGGRTEQAIAAELQRRARITAETFYRQGLNQQREQKLEEALTSFDLALVWDPTYDEAARADSETQGMFDDREAGQHLAAGIARYQQGELIGAITEFGRALDSKPDYQSAKEWLKNASEALLKARPGGGVLQGGKAEQIDRHLQQGLTFLTGKEYRRAIEEWQQILALDPKHAGAKAYIAQARTQQQQAVGDLLQRAERNTAQGRWSSALGQVNQALVLDPGDTTAQAKKQQIATALNNLSSSHANNGIELYNQGKFGPAAAELKLALSFNKDNKDAAEYLKKVGSKMVKVRGQDINDLYLKGINAYTQEDYEQAVAYWQQVVEIDPGYTKARRNIERAQQKLKIIGR